MAIASDGLIDFFGTADDLDSTSALVTNGSFSIAGDTAEWTNDEDAPEASMLLICQHPSGTIDAGAHINLYRQMLEIDGASDDAPVPDADYPHDYAGTFMYDENASAATDQFKAIDVDLPNSETSQKYHWFIENKTGVTLSAGWILKIKPKTVGPAA